MTTAKELLQKTDTELERELVSLRGTLRDLRFKIASRQLKDVREVRETKRGIARVLTALGAVRKAAPATDTKKNDTEAK